jgi:hypothetical protein
MIFAGQIVGLVRVGHLRCRPCALVWQNDQVLLVPRQGLQCPAGLLQDSVRRGGLHGVRVSLYPASNHRPAR